jgi:hypothetical protein
MKNFQTVKAWWAPIEYASTSGKTYWVYVAPKDGLPGFQTYCAYHPDAGWCADEIREVTHFLFDCEEP